MDGFCGYKTCNELPPGFRFHPTDEELVTHYLSPKVLDCNFTTQAVGEVDFNKVEPWDLPWRANIGEEEWYFYCLKDRKYPTGSRTNRATDAGYWKATGKDKEIFRRRILVGMKKTLVFYKGRAPNGEKTNWVMHEYRLQRKKSTISPKEWVICRVFKKSSRGNKVQISRLVRSSYSRLDLPPLMDMDLSSDETIRNAGEGPHVTRFPNPKQVISSDEYSSSLINSFLCPDSIFSAQLNPCIESLHCPGSIFKQEQMTNCYEDGDKLHDDDPINFSEQIDLDCLWSY